MPKKVDAVSLIASVRSNSNAPRPNQVTVARYVRRTGTKCSDPPKGASAPDRPKKRAGGRLVGEQHISLGELRTRVTIRIYELRNRNLFFFTQSHFLHTPKQMDPYMTNAGYGDSYKAASCV